MENKTSHTSRTGKAARLTGGAIVLMAIVSMITVGVFHASLFPEIITENVVLKHTESSAMLLTILGWSLIALLDFIVSWGVYVILNKSNRTMALISATLRLIYTLILCASISRLVVLLNAINGKTLSQTHLADLIEHTGAQFNFIWQLGLIIFGLHLMILGISFIKLIPNTMIVFSKMKMLYVLLIIGGVGYILTSGLVVLNLGDTSIYTVINSIMLLPMIVGELGLGIGLLFKGQPSFNAA